MGIYGEKEPRYEIGGRDMRRSLEINAVAIIASIGPCGCDCLWPPFPQETAMCLDFSF